MLKITSESQTGRLEPSPQEGASMAIILQWLRSRVTVKLNFRPYIRRYTSPNENFEYSYPLNMPTK